VCEAEAWRHLYLLRLGTPTAEEVKHLSLSMEKSFLVPHFPEIFQGSLDLTELDQGFTNILAEGHSTGDQSFHPT